MSRHPARLKKLERAATTLQEAPLCVVVRDDDPVPPSHGRPLVIIRLPRKLTEAAWVEEAKACWDEHGNINLAAWRARHPAYTLMQDRREP